MQGRTNATIISGSGGGSSGDLIYAQNNLLSDTVNAGDKVLLKKFATTNMQHKEIPIDNYNSDYGTSFFGPIGGNLLLNANNPRSTDRTQTLNVINDDLSLNKIASLAYQASSDYMTGYYYAYTTYEFLLGKWLFYCGHYGANCVNLETLQNNQYNKFIYQGDGNIFSTTQVGAYSGPQKLYKFNEETGGMDEYCDLFADVMSYYTFYAGMFYKNLFLCYHAYGRNVSVTLKLYKINPETNTFSLVADYGAYPWTNPHSYEMAPFVQLCPGYALAAGSSYYCIKLDDVSESMSYNIIDTLGYSGLRNQYYNHQNRTFSILETSEDDRLMLHILKFNPENTLSFEKVRDVDLTKVRDELRAETGFSDLEVYGYGAVSDNLDRIRIVFESPKSSYSYRNVLINLDTALSDWTIVDNSYYNYDEKALTAFATGNVDENKKVEVKTVLPEKLQVTIEVEPSDAVITTEGEA